MVPKRNDRPELSFHLRIPEKKEKRNEFNKTQQPNGVDVLISTRKTNYSTLNLLISIRRVRALKIVDGDGNDTKCVTFGISKQCRCADEEKKTLKKYVWKWTRPSRVRIVRRPAGSSVCIIVLNDGNRILSYISSTGRMFD